MGAGRTTTTRASARASTSSRASGGSRTSSRTSSRTTARGLGTAPRTQLRPAGAGGHTPPPSGPSVGSSARRQWVLMWIVVAVLALFAARLVQVQVVEAATLAEQGRDTRARVIPLEATRGEIVDASGMVMATSVVRYDVQVDLRQIPAYVRLAEERTAGEEPVILGRGAVEAVKQLAPLLGVSEHELGAQLTGTAGGLTIAKEVTPEVREQIEELGINGLTTHSTTKRVYPNGTTAGDLVGWVNNEQNGAAGLEYSLNGELQGVDGERSYETGVGGTVIPFAQQSTVPAQDGPTVHTSIDLDLQYVCQNSVDGQVSASNAEFGAAVVIEAKTGRVLALCDSGATDPNAPTGSGTIRSITSPYEPGSTGKILTVASALNEGLITPTSTFTVPDRLTMPNGQTFKDATEHPEHELTTAGILAFSSNTGTVQIGDLMTDAKRVEYMNAFGWGDRTGIELGGEQAGTNLDPTQWDGRTRYVTMFGQANQVNLLQITNVMATLGNGGVRLPLHLVDGYSDEGGTFTPAEHGEGVEVVTKQTSDEMLLMLEGVMADQLGTTGKKAAIDGYRVAGKTGTAQIPNKVDGRLTDTAASFVGVAPAEDPEIAVGVIIFRPAGAGTGGGVAAPVFHDVASAALQMLGIPPSGTTETLYELYGDTAE